MTVPSYQPKGESPLGLLVQILTAAVLSLALFGEVKKIQKRTADREDKER